MRTPLEVYRIACDMKQYHVAARLNVSTSQYARLEAGQAALTADQRKTLAAMYGTTELDRTSARRGQAAVAAAAARLIRRTFGALPNYRAREVSKEISK